MFAFNLSASTLASVATIGVAASKDAVTPIITGVQITVEGGRVLTAVATDRYRIARAQYRTAVEGSTDQPELATDGDGVPTVHSVVIPAAFLTKVAKAIAFKGRSESQTVALAVAGEGTHSDPYRITVTDPATGTVLTETGIAGNYPPVGRLILPVETYSENMRAGLRLNPSFLGDLAKIAYPGERPADTKVAPWAMHAHAAGPDNRTAPVMFTRDNSGTGIGLIEYVVQPCMPTR